MHLLRFAALALFACLAACGPAPGTVTELNVRTIRFPDGTSIKADLAVLEADLVKGMKYRESLDEDRGMLFIYANEGMYPFWMYEVKVPLDMLWLDKDRKIVQLVHQCPPCAGPPAQCPSYGGQVMAQYILEVKAGVAKKHGLRPGMVLDF